MTRRRAGILAAIAGALVLFGGYTAYWFIVAGRLETGIDDWAAAQRQAGITLEFERSKVGGFPFSFSATFRKPHAAGLIAGRPIDWYGPELEVRVSPFDLRSIALIAPGRHQVDLGQGLVTLDSERLEVRLAVGSDGLLSSTSASFSRTHATLADGRNLAVASGSLSLTAPAEPPQSDQDSLLQFSLAAKDLALPPGILLLTADPIGDVTAAGTVKGPMPAAPLRTALASWRDQGGTVEISSFTVAQATLSLAGKATIALDAALQPIVAADLQARGLGPTIDLLESQHRLRPEDALKMRLFLKGAERDAAGGGKELATGLTLQGGILSWGPFRLARVPPIVWP